MSVTTAAWENSRPQDKFSAATIASCALFVAYVCVRLAAQMVNEGVIHFEDDAYYYTKIARSILETGLSTFDGQVLTNGYQPLWLIVVGFWELLFGPSDPHLVVLLEIVLATGALWLLLTSLNDRSLAFQVAFSAIFTLLAWPMIAKGMELSLLLFCLALFLRFALREVEGSGNAVALGLAACLCIGARIDSAVFVLPILVLACGGLRRSVQPLVIVAGAGIVYAALNLWLFGLPVPISGTVKSLGSPQINHALINQIGEFHYSPFAMRDWSAVATTAAGQLVMFFYTTIGRVAAMSVLALAAAATAWRDPRCRVVGGGYLIGLTLYATKLVFFSNWVLGSWYAYPAIVALFVIFLAADYQLRRTQVRLKGRMGTVAAALLIGITLTQLTVSTSKAEINPQPINLRAIAAFGPVFKDAHIAMGDIAGSFGLYYPGQVTQLEGLVNDKAYIGVLKGETDLKQLLCDRGVRYVVSYERDLGPYETASIPIMRPEFSSFPAPTLTFRRADEVGRVFAYRLGSAGDAVGGQTDKYVYAWRLSGCAGDGHNTASIQAREMAR